MAPVRFSTLKLRNKSVEEELLWFFVRIHRFIRSCLNLYPNRISDSRKIHYAMKPILIVITLFLSASTYAQTYKVGILKTGAAVKNVDGLIVMADTVVTSTIDGQTTTMK